MAVYKGFISTTCRFNQPYVRPVELCDGLEALFIAAAHQRDFAIHIQRPGKPGGLLAFQRDGDAADGDITLLCQKIGHQVFPAGWHPLHFRAERGSQRVRHADIQPFILTIGSQVAVRLVIAGGADLKRFRTKDGVEMRLCLDSTGGQQQREDNFFHFAFFYNCFHSEFACRWCHKPAHCCFHSKSVVINLPFFCDRSARKLSAIFRK